MRRRRHRDVRIAAGARGRDACLRNAFLRDACLRDVCLRDFFLARFGGPGYYLATCSRQMRNQD